MALLRVMLVLSAIAMSVVSFPSTGRVEEMELHTEEATDSTLQHALQSELIAENNNSSIVEFVKQNHKENFTVESGAENEKYIITNISTKKNNFKDSETENDFTVKDFSDIENFNSKNVENLNFPSTLDQEEKSGIFIYEDNGSLHPKESSAITEEISKYFFGIIEPPFPEISRGPKPRLNFNLKDEKTESVKPLLMPKKVYHRPYSVGPALYPQSIYNREFSIPFFE